MSNVREYIEPRTDKTNLSVKLLCMQFNCIHNLKNRTGEVCCNLKNIVINENAECSDKKIRDYSKEKE